MNKENSMNNQNIYCVLLIYLVDMHENKKRKSIVEGFQSILKNSGRKPNNIWVDHGSEFYNNKFRSFLTKMKLKCIQLIMKENQLLQKDLSRPQKVKSINI